MSEKITVPSVGLFFIVFSVVSLWYLWREYRLRGKLSWFGSLLHVMIFTVNGMFIGMLVWGPIGIPPISPLYWLGIPLMVVGLVIVLYAMDLFRNFSCWLGNNTPGLKTTGLYNLSRNPQFVGYGVFTLAMESGRSTHL